LRAITPPPRRPHEPPGLPETELPTSRRRHSSNVRIPQVRPSFSDYWEIRFILSSSGYGSSSIERTPRMSDAHSGISVPLESVRAIVKLESRDEIQPRPVVLDVVSR
jgi:hypothetical protein